MKNQFYRRYNIIVCGTGATGSQLIPFLTQLLSYKENCSLVFVDGDRVETKNLRNQKFLDKDNGLPKSRILQQRYSNVYPKLNISFMDTYVQDASQLIDLTSSELDTLNILIGCVDNNPTRKILKDVFNSGAVGQIVYIDSGNGTESMQGQIVTGYKTTIGTSKPNAVGYAGTTTTFAKVMAPCAGDLFVEITEDTDTVDHVTSCSYVGDKNPQNIATNVMAASTVFGIVNQIIAFGNIPTGITYFDAKNQSITHREIITENYEDLKCEVTISADNMRDDFEFDIDSVIVGLAKNTMINVCGHKIEHGDNIELKFGSAHYVIDGNDVTFTLESSVAELMSPTINLEFVSGILSEHLEALEVDAIIPFIENEDDEYLENAMVKSMTFSYGENTYNKDISKMAVEQYDENGHLIREGRFE